MMPTATSTSPAWAALAVAKLGTGHGGTMTDGEMINVVNWLDSWAPAPPPVVTRNGETVYNDNCSGCHKVNTYDALATSTWPARVLSSLPNWAPVTAAR